MTAALALAPRSAAQVFMIYPLMKAPATTPASVRGQPVNPNGLPQIDRCGNGYGSQAVWSPAVESETAAAATWERSVMQISGEQGWRRDGDKWSW